MSLCTSSGDASPTLIGYLIPEFPGQTHSFFWREIRELRQLGVQPELVSTRPPDQRIQSHEWSRQAVGQTSYLFPPTAGACLGGLVELIRARPAGWWRTCKAVCSAGVKSIPRNLALALMGANLAALARQRGWKHLHTHSCANACLIAVFANRISGLSYSLTLHGPLHDYGTQQPLKWRHASFAVVITRKLMAEVHAQLGPYLPAALELAPMGVNLAVFQRKSGYQPWAGQGPARLVSCGRLNRVKGHQELIEAVRLLRDKGFDVQLHICGEDERAGDGFHRQLQAQIDEAGLGAAVRLLGAVSEQRVRDEIESAHLFTLASHHEPLGVAIMEAMAMGLPVITTNAGGVPELVDHEHDGILVNPKEPAAIAEAVERVLHDSALAVRLASAARAKIERSFHSGLSAQAIARYILGQARAVAAPPVAARVAL
jgi:glycosyltransferase involved in cell wall biosynthesis